MIAAAARLVPRQRSVAWRLRVLSVAVVAEAALLAVAGMGALAGTQDDVVRSSDQHRLHVALADADRYAAEEFLSSCQTTNPGWTTQTPVLLTYCRGTVESGGHRLLYQGAIGSATTELKRAAEDSGSDAGASQRLQGLDAQVAQYSDLVETGRANTRLDQPVGAAYLRAASTLLHQGENGAGILSRDEREPAILAQVDGLDGLDPAGDSPPVGGRALLVVTLLLATALLATLLLVQRSLRRRFRRRYNAGLAAATLVLVPFLAWMAVLVVEAGQVPLAGASQPVARWHAMEQARAQAHDAIADESLALIPGGGETAAAADAAALRRDLSGTDVAAADQRFDSTRAAIRTDVDAGRLGAGIARLSCDRGADCVHPTLEDSFGDLDRSLRGDLARDAGGLAASLGLAADGAGSVTMGGAGAVRLVPIAVALVVAVLVVLGMQPRIDEYRRAS